MNTIPLVKGNTQEEINTSLIALKKALDEMNSSSGKTDASVQSQIKQINELITSINSHLDTIDGQITGLQPVDTVTSGNMQSVTSNAVAQLVNCSTNERQIGTYLGRPHFEKIVIVTVPDYVGAEVQLNIEPQIPETIAVTSFEGVYIKGDLDNYDFIMHIPYTYINVNDSSRYLNIYIYFDANSQRFVTVLGGTESSGYYKNGHIYLTMHYIKLH
jgi:hypothetical protein